MRVSPFVFAAETEQAVAVAAVLDVDGSWASAQALDELAARYGLAGWDLINEYENEPNIADDTVPPLYFVFH
jgi:endo-beta-N-acetylglucosaminidase D